ncbi:hypothetical protein [Actinomadura sp. 9N215]|uniref:hypothetical protein n=1 Tax=Actinomadura sp. 9N215 TaxID=3375150 RepID=UPI0037ABDD93
MTEWDEEALARLRAAVHRGDWAAGLEVLRDRPLEPVLQYAGDVALTAVARGRAEGARLAQAEGARLAQAEGARLAADCRALLAERGHPGDTELAMELATELAAEARAEPTTELAAPPGHTPHAALLPLPVDLGAVAAAMDDGFHVLDLERGDVLAADELPDDEAQTQAQAQTQLQPHGAERWLAIPPGSPPEGPESEDARRGVARRWLAEQGYRPVPRTL